MKKDNGEVDKLKKKIIEARAKWEKEAPRYSEAEPRLRAVIRSVRAQTEVEMGGVSPEGSSSQMEKVTRREAVSDSGYESAEIGGRN